MEQLVLFDPIDRSNSGATWWAGAYQCRNWNGYFQSREGGTGLWQFTIYAFGEDDAVVIGLDQAGARCHIRVPMDAQDRLIIDGKRYGRSKWSH